MRSVDGGARFTSLGLPVADSRAAWSALCLCPDGSLLAASFRTSDTGGSQVWRITSPRSRHTVTLDATAPPVVEDIAVVDGVVYAACGPHGLYRVDPTGGWTAALARLLPGLPPVLGHGAQRRPLGRQRHRHDRPPLHRQVARCRPHLRLEDDARPRLERRARRRPQLVAGVVVARPGQAGLLGQPARGRFRECQHLLLGRPQRRGRDPRRRRHVAPGDERSRRLRDPPGPGGPAARGGVGHRHRLDRHPHPRPLAHLHAGVRPGRAAAAAPGGARARAPRRPLRGRSSRTPARCS